MTEPLQDERREVTIPISCCSICDKDRDPLEVPGESCGHDHKHAEIRNVLAVPKVALDQALAERDHYRRALEFYAKPRGYGTGKNSIFVDDCQVAREVLKEEAKAQAPQPHEQ